MCKQIREYEYPFFIVFFFSGICWLSIGIAFLVINLNHKDNIYLNNKQIDDSYSMVKLMIAINKTNMNYLSVGTDCSKANNLSIQTCDNIIKNKIYGVDKCLIQNACVSTICKPCSYVCFTKNCWIPEQQTVCLKSMENNNCRVSYTDKSTYVCTGDPINSTGICQEKCSDFACQSYDYYCGCVCTEYSLGQCNVINNTKIETSYKIFYQTNNQQYIYNTAKHICNHNDSNCINMYNKVNIDQYIYYNIKNATNYELSLEKFYEIVTDKTKNLIIFGYVAIMIGVLALLFGFLPHRIDRIEISLGVPVNVIIHADPDDSQPSCTICFENLNSNTKNVALVCCHVFHTACIEKWKSRNPTCPVCRTAITS
jgi:hypothetical protein